MAMDSVPTLEPPRPEVSVGAGGIPEKVDDRHHSRRPANLLYSRWREVT